MRTQIGTAVNRGCEDRDEVSLNGDGRVTRDVAAPVSGVPRPTHGTLLPAEVAVDEPPEPRRIRRPPDLMRLLFETGLIAIVLLLAIPGAGTTTGLETDI